MENIRDAKKSMSLIDNTIAPHVSGLSVPTIAGVISIQKKRNQARIASDLNMNNSKFIILERKKALIESESRISTALNNKKLAEEIKQYCGYGKIFKTQKALAEKAGVDENVVSNIMSYKSILLSNLFKIGETIDKENGVEFDAGKWAVLALYPILQDRMEIQMLEKNLADPEMISHEKQDSFPSPKFPSDLTERSALISMLVSICVSLPVSILKSIVSLVTNIISSAK